MTLKAIGATLITLLVTSIAQAQTPVTVFFTPATPHSAFITKASKDYDAVYTKLASILKDKQKKDYLLVNSSEKATITFTVVSIEQADGNAVTSRTAECLLLRCADTETRTERGLQVHATLTVNGNVVLDILTTPVDEVSPAAFRALMNLQEFIKDNYAKKR